MISITPFHSQFRVNSFLQNKTKFGMQFQPIDRFNKINSGDVYFSGYPKKATKWREEIKEFYDIYKDADKGKKSHQYTEFELISNYQKDLIERIGKPRVIKALEDKGVQDYQGKPLQNLDWNTHKTTFNFLLQSNGLEKIDKLVKESTDYPPATAMYNWIQYFKLDNTDCEQWRQSLGLEKLEVTYPQRS